MLSGINNEREFMKRAPKIISTYVNEDGVTVSVVAPAKQKPSTWMRGEMYCNITQRMDGEASGMITRISRKNGKY